MKEYTLTGAIALIGGYLLLAGDKVYADLSSGGTFYVYDPVKRKNIGYTTKKEFEAVTKEQEPEKVLLGGFQSWIETYSEILPYMTLAAQNSGKSYSLARETQEMYGSTGVRELAVEMTDQFQEQFKDYDWDNGDFYETTEAFARAKDLGITYEQARTAVERQIITEGKINLIEIDQITEDFEINNDQKNQLCDADLIRYRSEFGWHYFKEDIDKIKLILNPQPFQDNENRS